MPLDSGIRHNRTAVPTIIIIIARMAVKKGKFEPVEYFSMIGFPARLAGRAPLLARYLSGPPRVFKATNQYALQRYGRTFKLRPWLYFDIDELEQIEQLINYGSDEEVLQFRQAQLDVGGMNTVVVSPQYALHPI